MVLTSSAWLVSLIALSLSSPFILVEEKLFFCTSDTKFVGFVTYCNSDMYVELSQTAQVKGSALQDWPPLKLPVTHPSLSPVLLIDRLYIDEEFL